MKFTPVGIIPIRKKSKNMQPFLYGTTVSTGNFTNREKDVEKLRNNLLNGINTMLMSPRRWGKSSLVEKVIQDIRKKEKNVRPVIIDLFSVGSEEAFLETFAREVIKSSSSKWEEWMRITKELFKMLAPKISMGIDPQSDFSLSFDWKELKKHSDEILNLPEAIAKKKNIRILICLDEFQNLSSYPGYQILEKKMRASWQRHKRVTYCLYGSKRHMMADIFNNPAKPFYRFGDIMMLPKIETPKWVAFICKKFAETGKTIKVVDAELIARLMKNHSWYIQQLAHYTWNNTKKTVTRNEIETALNELIQANSPLYQKEVEVLSATQLNLLKAVVKGESRFTGTGVMQQYHLGTPNNVSKNKAILIKNDCIQEENGKFEFVDPAFELWFKKQFFNSAYFDFLMKE